jgi:CubicO group peptidase (beta-lactamase class C family)
MSNSAADDVSWTSALDGVVAETAAGRLLPGVHRCLLRVETPRQPEGWTGTATTHRNDHAGLDTEAASRIASVTKMMTATACWYWPIRAAAGSTIRLVVTSPATSLTVHAG